jgi:transcriptional regulator with XRE-family HTH domain
MEDCISNQFGCCLKKLRKARNLTQQKLADNSSLTPCYISILERNLKTPSLHTISALATALEMKPSELMRELEEFPAS